MSRIDAMSLINVCTDKFVPNDKPKKVGSYRLERIIGEGKYATVRIAVHEDLNRQVAIKSLPKYQSRRGAMHRQLFLREQESLRRLRHPNIPALYDTMETGRNMYLVLELVNGRTLEHVLDRGAPLDEDDTKIYFLQLSSVVGHVHGSGFVHRDIKPANILVINGSKRIKLIDFGLCTPYKSETPLTRQCGTPLYTAPEVYARTTYGPPADVWAMGVVLFEMLTGQIPFFSDRPRNTSELHGSILKTLVLPYSMEPDCAQLVKSLLNTTPESRPTCDEVSRHTWLAETTMPQQCKLPHDNNNSPVVHATKSETEAKNLESHSLTSSCSSL